MKDERVSEMEIDISRLEKDEDKINSKEVQKKADEILKQLSKEYDDKHKDE